MIRSQVEFQNMARRVIRRGYDLARESESPRKGRHLSEYRSSAERSHAVAPQVPFALTKPAEGG